MQYENIISRRGILLAQPLNLTIILLTDVVLLLFCQSNTHSEKIDFSL